MKESRGKEIFRSKYKKKMDFIIFCSTLTILLFIISIGIIINFFTNFLNIKFSSVTVIFLLIFSIFVLIVGFSFLLVLISFFVTYLIIYENGILIRDQSSELFLFTFLKYKYIPFEQIIDVELSKELFKDYVSEFSVLSIYRKDQNVFKVDERRISNYKEAESIIKKKIKE